MNRHTHTHTCSADIYTHNANQYLLFHGSTIYPTLLLLLLHIPINPRPEKKRKSFVIFFLEFSLFCLEWKEKKILPTSLPSPLDSVTLQRTRKKVHWLFFLFVSSFSSSTKSFYRLSVCVTEKRRPLYKCTTLSLSLECVCVWGPASTNLVETVVVVVDLPMDRRRRMSKRQTLESLLSSLLPQRMDQNGRFRVVSQDGGNCGRWLTKKKGKKQKQHCLR